MSAMLRATSATLVVLVIALVGLGSVVHSTGASLACPDWPLCGGEVFPEMVGGVEFEHSHRILAGLVALLSALVAYQAWSRRAEDRSRALLAVAAVGLVLVQAALGAMTVLMRLPPAVSTAHFATSMIFLLMCAEVARRTWWSEPARAHLAGARKFATALVYAQLVLGALVRHLGAGYACGRDPWGCAPLLSSAPALPALQIAHRVLGVVLVGVLFWLARRAAAAGARVHGGILANLVVAQVALGLATIASGISIPIVTAHAVVGAVLLLTTATLGRLSVRHSSASARTALA